MPVVYFHMCCPFFKTRNEHSWVCIIIVDISYNYLENKYYLQVHVVRLNRPIILWSFKNMYKCINLQSLSLVVY